MSRRKLENAESEEKRLKVLKTEAVGQRPRALSSGIGAKLNYHHDVPGKMLVDEAMATLRRENLKYIQLMFTDYTGQLRSLEEHSEQLPSFVAYGVGVDGSSVPGYAVLDKSDVKLVPEPDTFRVFTVGEEKIAIIMCHVETPEGIRHPHDPRNVLHNVIQRTALRNCTAYFMSELEFFLLEDGEPVDKGGYLCVPPEDGSMVFRHEMAAMFEDAGIRVKRLHHECAPGQNELELNLSDAMKNADDTLLGIWLTKMLADADGIQADFSPKPLPHMAGNGLHQHIQLIDNNGGNVFAGTVNRWLSSEALKFIAGLVKYADDIVAVQSRSDSSFERMKPGHEAPGISAWDFMNRSAMIRLPMITAGNEHKARVEFRAGDASGSAHLLTAALLLAGIKGIEEGLVCPKNTALNLDHVEEKDLPNHGLHRLPHTAENVKEILMTSGFVKELLTPGGCKLLADSL